MLTDSNHTCWHQYGNIMYNIIQERHIKLGSVDENEVMKSF